MKDAILLFWNIIYQYVFFHIYKQYLKVKQNRAVKARRLFSPWKMRRSVRLLGKDDFSALVKVAYFLFVLKSFEMRSYLYFPRECPL